MKNKKINRIFAKYKIHKISSNHEYVIIRSRELLEIKNYIKQLKLENTDVMAKYNKIAYNAADLLSNHSVGCPSEEKSLSCTINSTTCLNCWMNALKKL